MDKIEKIIFLGLGAIVLMSISYTIGAVIGYFDATYQFALYLEMQEIKEFVNMTMTTTTDYVVMELK